MCTVLSSVIIIHEQDCLSHLLVFSLSLCLYSAVPANDNQFPTETIRAPCIEFHLRPGRFRCISSEKKKWKLMSFRLTDSLNDLNSSQIFRMHFQSLKKSMIRYTFRLHLCQNETHMKNGRIAHNISVCGFGNQKRQRKSPESTKCCCR